MRKCHRTFQVSDRCRQRTVANGKTVPNHRPTPQPRRLAAVRLDLMVRRHSPQGTRYSLTTKLPGLAGTLRIWRNERSTNLSVTSVALS